MLKAVTNNFNKLIMKGSRFYGGLFCYLVEANVNVLLNVNIYKKMCNVLIGVKSYRYKIYYRN